MLEAACQVLIEQQHELQDRLPRCNGRTLLRRQQTLLRLLRMRHLIEINGDDRLDLARLARSANYSPCHLIRMHREVFDETPSEYAGRLRLDRAWSLVRDTRMPVCEITEALGFESQSSFCRAFKHAYGATTGQVRHGGSVAKSSPQSPIIALMARRAA
jgi:transcriptional regulator GlxA family with amidase domain